MNKNLRRCTKIFEDLIQNYLHPNPNHQPKKENTYQGIGERAYTKQQIIPGINKTQTQYTFYITEKETPQLEQILIEPLKYEKELTLQKTNIIIHNKALGALIHLLIPATRTMIEITTNTIMRETKKIGEFKYTQQDNLYLITEEQYREIAKK